MACIYITIPTTPGGGKKLHQKKRSRTNQTATIGPKGKKIKNESDDEM